MKGCFGPRLSTLVLVLMALGCTQLKPVPSQPTVPTTPAGDAPASDAVEVPDPPAFEEPTPSPTPVPTPTPLPAAKVVLVSPTLTSDFTLDALDVSFTVTPPDGRKIVSATLSYDGAVLKQFNEAGPSFKLEGWNPNVANSSGEKPDTTPVPSGDHKLLITVKDDAGKETRHELSFVKPLKITGWTTVADMPQANSHAMAFADGAFPPGYLNMWGSLDGVETSLVPRTQVYSFNPAGDGSWTEIKVTGTSIPRGAYGAALHPGGTIAYLIGGKVGGQDLNTVEVLSPLRKVAEQAPAAMANARRDAAGAYVDDHVYAVGGLRGESALYSVERIKIGTDGNPTGAWEARADMQNARAGANAYVNGREIWVFGGGFKPIEIFDTRKNEWRFLTGQDNAVIGTPEGWANSLMVPVGDRLFFFGGTREDGQAVEAVYEFALKTKTWRNVGPLPTIADLPAEQRPETRMSGFYLDGAFYLMGGKSVPDNQITKKVFKATTL